MRVDAYDNGQDILNYYKSGDMKFTDKGYPIIKALTNIDNTIKMIPFNYANSSKDTDSYIHFYIQDYMFNRIWNNPDRYVEVLKRFKGIVQPDFSVYTDMPRVLQQFNVYRNNWYGAYCQQQGIEVIPSVTWADKESYSFCFDGMPKHSVICLSSIGSYMSLDTRKLFYSGLKECLIRLEPITILLRSSVRARKEIIEYIKSITDIPIINIDYSN